MQPLITSPETSRAYTVYPRHTSYATIQPHRSTENHYHNIYHIVFTFQGTGRLLNGTDTISLEPGVITCIDPGDAHIFTTGTGRLFYYAFNFYLLPWNRHETGTAVLPDATLEKHAETLPLHCLFGIPEKDGVLVYDARERNGIINLVRNFDAQNEAYVSARYVGDETEAHTAWYRYHAFTFLHALLFTYLVPRPRTSEKPGAIADPLIAKAITYMEANVTAKFSLNELAAAVGKNAGYLSGYFSRHMGMTAGAYFNRLKIKQACVQLKTTQKPITDIAYDLGFSSSQHFSMRFKEIKKVSPKKFRDTLESY